MLDAYRDLIDELLETPTAIRSAIENGPETPPDLVAADVALIRDHDLQVLEWARLMMRREDAVLDNRASDHPGAAPSLNEALAEMEAARGDLVSLLINLSLKDWERTAILQSGAQTTLSDIVEAHVEFDETARGRVLGLLGGG